MLFSGEKISVVKKKKVPNGKKTFVTKRKNLLFIPSKYGPTFLGKVKALKRNNSVLFTVTFR